MQGLVGPGVLDRHEDVVGYTCDAEPGGVGPEFGARKLAAAESVFDLVVDVFDRARFLAMPREQGAAVFVPPVGEEGVVMFVVAVGK